MTNTAKEARKEIIAIAKVKGVYNVMNSDLNELQKRGYTFKEVSAALRWLTYSPQAAKYRA